MAVISIDRPPATYTLTLSEREILLIKTVLGSTRHPKNESSNGAYLATSLYTTLEKALENVPRMFNIVNGNEIHDIR